jgi:hypothetical protein
MEVIPPSPVLDQLFNTNNAILNNPAFLARIQQLTLETREREIKLFREKYLNPNNLAGCQGKSLPLSFDAQELQKLVTTEFFNIAVLQEIQCLLSIIFIGSLDPKRTNKNISLIKSVLHPSVRLTSGSYGEVYQTQVSIGNTDASRLLVMKVDNGKRDTLTHEMTIGLNVANKLREEIPNFAYVYGGFNGLKPIIAQDNAVIDWAQYPSSSINRLPGITGGQQLPYVAYENIVSQDGSKAKTLREFIVEVSSTEIFSILLQLVFALKIANDRFSFTHYDLHDQNILIRKLTRTRYIPYSLTTDTGQTKIVYIRSQYVATIIDYGASFFSLTPDGVKEGYYGLYWLGNLGDRSFPLYDFYKILCFMLQSSKNAGNAAVFALLAPILSGLLARINNNGRLEKESFDSVVQNQVSRSFALPPIPELLKISSNNIADYVLKFLPVVVESGGEEILFSANDPFFSDNALSCLSSSSIRTPRGGEKGQTCNTQPQIEAKIKLTSDAMNIYDLINVENFTAEEVDMVYQNIELYLDSIKILQQDVSDLPILPQLLPDAFGRYAERFLELYAEANRSQELYLAINELMKKWDFQGIEVKAMPKETRDKLNSILLQLKDKAVKFINTMDPKAQYFYEIILYLGEI